MAREAPGTDPNARDQLIASGWAAPILGTIIELIDERTQWLLDATAARRKPARSGLGSAARDGDKLRPEPEGWRSAAPGMPFVCGQIPI